VLKHQAYSPADIGLDPGEICTKLENVLYDAEFNGEQHIKSTQKPPFGQFLGDKIQNCCRKISYLPVIVGRVVSSCQLLQTAFLN